jgi:ferredoxin
MKVVLDASQCVGHGRCYTLVPELFVDDDLGQGQVRGDGRVPEGLEKQALRAVSVCPEQAISVLDDPE